MTAGNPVVEIAQALAFASRVYRAAAESTKRDAGADYIERLADERETLSKRLLDAAGPDAVDAARNGSSAPRDWFGDAGWTAAIVGMERELLRLSEVAYLSDAGEEAKRILEEVAEACAQALDELAPDPPTADPLDAAMASVEADRPGVERDATPSSRSGEDWHAGLDPMEDSGSPWPGGTDEFERFDYQTPFDHGVGGAGYVDPDDRGEVERADDTADVIDLYPVWFATNRAPKDAARPELGFTGRRSADGVRHGRCLVHVPKSHALGTLGPGSLRRLLLGGDALAIRRREPLTPEAFWTQVDGAATGVGRERHAVVFIHGYNVTFDGAALRAAQLGHDLGVTGPMAFFSWPSKGRLIGYFADGNSVEASEPEITEFLTSLATLPNVEAVHVIAHSMGNRGALRAVARIAADAQRLSGRRFGHFVLAAADVDAKVFRDNARVYVELGAGTTLYVSPRDRALSVASIISDFARAGRTPPVSIVDGVDTIDVGAIDLDHLGHGYVAENQPVLGDIHELLTSGRRPGERFRLEERTDGGGRRYWGFRR